MSMAPAEAQRPMHIVWVVDGVEGSEAQGYRSNLASNRYRAILPAQALRDKGHRVTFVSAKDWRWQPESAPDVVVIGTGAGGMAAAVTARKLKDLALHPFALSGNAIDDYRDKKQVESQYATFLPSLAELKARRVSARHPSAMVIGADSTLACNGRQFDKPPTLAAAREQLLALAGQTHDLCSSVVVARAGVRLVELEPREMGDAPDIWQGQGHCGVQKVRQIQLHNRNFVTKKLGAKRP